MSNYLSQGHSSGAGAVTEALTLSMALSQQLYTLEQRLKTNLCSEQQEAGVASSKATKTSLQMQSGTMIARGIEQAVCGFLQGASMGISKLYSNFSQSGKLANNSEAALRNNEDFLKELAIRKNDPAARTTLLEQISAVTGEADGNTLVPKLEEKLYQHSFAPMFDESGTLISDGKLQKANPAETEDDRNARWREGEFTQDELLTFAAGHIDHRNALTQKWQLELTGHQNDASRNRQIVQAYEKVLTDMGDLLGKATQAISSGGQATATWLQGTQDASRTLNDMITNLAKTSSDQADGVSQQQLSALNQLEQALQTWISTSQRPA